MAYRGGRGRGRGGFGGFGVEYAKAEPFVIFPVSSKLYALIHLLSSPLLSSYDAKAEPSVTGHYLT